jgi:type III restriction enzyme
LNQSYAFVVSRNFAETAGALRDRLVAGAGFERREVSEFVTAAKSRTGAAGSGGPRRAGLRSAGGHRTARKARSQGPAEAGARQAELGRPAEYPDHQRAADGRRDREVLKASVTSEAAAAAIVQAAEASRTTPSSSSRRPAELGERFQVPQLAWRVQGELQLFR